MTITSAMNASVAGLNANAARLGAISDNISNSGTYGYKRARTEFSSLVVSGGSGAGSYSAGGVRASTTRLVDEWGGLIGTSSPLDLAVAGRGMLPVTQETSLGESGIVSSLLMTRSGAFQLDESGLVKTETGLVLLGWPANADGTIPVFARDSITGLAPVIIKTNQPSSSPTTRVTLGVNLPAEEAVTGATGPSLPLGVEYFGNLGEAASLDITFTPTGVANEWTMVIRDSASGGTVQGEYVLLFDPTRPLGGNLLSVTTVSGGAYDPATGSLDINVAGGPMTITIGRPGEVGPMSQQAGTFAPVAILKDGAPVGSISALEVDQNGYLIATYDSGFTRRLYQIPLVDVPNPNGLTAMSNQTYRISQESGGFFLWDAGRGPTGTLEGYTREASTTDVAAELTALIQTQRAYSSNAKVIQTVDEMLQETTNIKR